MMRSSARLPTTASSMPLANFGGHTGGYAAYTTAPRTASYYHPQPASAAAAHTASAYYHAPLASSAHTASPYYTGAYASAARTALPYQPSSYTHPATTAEYYGNASAHTAASLYGSHLQTRGLGAHSEPAYHSTNASFPSPVFPSGRLY
jgi:hypothetical protein